jgi:hypothetical protein
MSSDRSMKRMIVSVRALAVAMILASGSPTTACPLVRLARLADEPITSLQHREVPLTQWASLEGGTWDVYLRRGGTLHSIVRTDFHETGRQKIRATFLTRGDFVIVSTKDRYKSPLPEIPVEIAGTVSTRYFFCNDVVYLPAMLNDESSGTQSLAEAKELKSIFFESDDVASYRRGVLF